MMRLFGSAAARPAAPGVREGAWLSLLLCLGLSATALLRTVRGIWFASGPTATVSCAEATVHGIPDGLVSISGCTLRLTQATLELEDDRVVAAYVPLTPTTGLRLTDAPLLYRTQHPADLALLQEAYTVQQSADPEPWVRAHYDALSPSRVLTGRASGNGWTHPDDAHHSSLHGGGPVLLTQRSLPSPWAPALVAAGLGLLAWLGFFRPPTGIVAGTGTRR